MKNGNGHNQIYFSEVKFKVLKYDRRTYEYYPIEIDINERNKKDE